MSAAPRGPGAAWRPSPHGAPPAASAAAPPPPAGGPSLAWLVIAGLAAAALAIASPWALIGQRLPVSAEAMLARSFSGRQRGRPTSCAPRLPRAVAAFACGGLLALAGALMQVLLRNLLADPYVLGISGGAAVGALGRSWPASVAAGSTPRRPSAPWARPCWCSASPTATARGPRPGCSSPASSSPPAAARRSPDAQPGPEGRVRGMLFWLMGDASGVTRPWPALVLLISGCSRLPFARELNLLARGGSPPAPSACGSGACARAGVWPRLAAHRGGRHHHRLGGFRGLIVPHLVRLAIGNDQRLLPRRHPGRRRCSPRPTPPPAPSSRRSSCRWACSPR